MGKNPEGDNGKPSPGEGGGWGPGPKIPDWAMGLNEKLGVIGGN